jgi:hypothetical protein
LQPPTVVDSFYLFRRQFRAKTLQIRYKLDPANLESRLTVVAAAPLMKSVFEAAAFELEQSADWRDADAVLFGLQQDRL